MADTSDPQPPTARRPAPKPAARGAARGVGTATFRVTPTAQKTATPKSAATPPAGDLSTLTGKSKALAATVVDSFCDRLVVEAERRGGMLTLRDIEALNEEFVRKTDALQAVFEKSFEDYVRARERAALQQTRNYPFDRLLVSKFERLFAKDKDIGPNKLSRRILPGFFMAMNKMLGPELIETYQERCRKIVQRIRQGRSDEMRWEEIYADRDAQALVMEAEITIAGYFEDVAKRSAWFVEVVNNNLAPAPADAPPQVASWQLAGPAFAHFLRALFGDIKTELASSDGRTRVTERYGIQTCLKLAEVMRRIG
jgi:hypothetical protein